MIYTSLLSIGNWRSYNIKLAKIIGINESIMLSELCYKFEYWITNKRLSADGFFYLTIEDCTDDTALSRKQQDTAIKNLLELQLISISKRPVTGGASPVRHFKINEENVLQLLNTGLAINETALNSQIELTQKDSLNCTKRSATNNQITNNKEDYNMCSRVSNSHFLEKNNTSRLNEQLKELSELNSVHENLLNKLSCDGAAPQSNDDEIDDKIDDIVIFMNATWSTSFRKDTKQTRRLLKKLIKNYSIEDIKLVITSKYDEWGVSPVKFKGGAFSNEYLRPSTIFGPNFDNYLQSAKIKCNNNNNMVAVSKAPSAERSKYEF